MCWQSCMIAAARSAGGGGGVENGEGRKPDKRILEAFFRIRMGFGMRIRRSRLMRWEGREDLSRITRMRRLCQRRAARKPAAQTRVQRPGPCSTCDRAGPGGTVADWAQKTGPAAHDPEPAGAANACTLM
ncbi:uncharacterized protein A4U43_C10F14060 [Asparagus officinalis]|uniref:Uncharacterized protein n=1 Tax=Asparagus officinalis TaxID=4686 RepID=A0A5P1E5V3_ASPOF|nr:uncharacterized protein A4U43_C10F14060 [Asparagus officinalis]